MKLRTLILLLFVSIGIYAKQYDIYICGQQVSDEKNGLTIGNGYIHVSPQNNAITISNLNYSGQETLLKVGSQISSVTVTFVGNSKIMSSNGCSMVFNSKETILYSRGTEDMESTFVTDGLETNGIITTSQKFEISQGTHSFYGKNNGKTTGLICENPEGILYITYSPIIKDSYIAGFENVEYEYTSTRFKDDVKYDSNKRCFVEEDGSTSVEKINLLDYKTIAQYVKDSLSNTELFTDLTKERKDILKDGTLLYNEEESIITFKDLNLVSLIWHGQKDTSTFILNGTNVINSLSLSSSKYTIITGNGTDASYLYCESEVFPFMASKTLLITSPTCHVYCSTRRKNGNKWVGYCIRATNLIIDGSYVTLDPCDSLNCALKVDTFEMRNCAIVYPSGAVWDSAQQCFTLNGKKVYDKIVIEPVFSSIQEVQNYDNNHLPTYNILGQIVNDDYHGVVIKQGKKILQ